MDRNIFEGVPFPSSGLRHRQLSHVTAQTVISATEQILVAQSTAPKTNSPAPPPSTPLSPKGPPPP
jgi:hypothetical protein